jgi:hypothetical protein
VMLRRRVVRVKRAVPSRASRFWTIVVAVARGMLSDSAARVKLFVSTIRMNVRIAVILSITIQTPVGVEVFLPLAAVLFFWGLWWWVFVFFVLLTFGFVCLRCWCFLVWLPTVLAFP